MSSTERPKGPIFKIVERDPNTQEPLSGLLDTSGLSGRRRRLIKENDCPSCLANYTRTVFTGAGRQDTPPFACQSMKFASPGPDPRVDFAPPKKGESIDTNVTLFLSSAACRPTQQ